MEETFLDTKFLKYVMEYKSITENELAAKTDMSVTRLREYLNGKPVQKLSFSCRIAKALDVGFAAVVKKKYFYLVPKQK